MDVVGVDSTKWKTNPFAATIVQEGDVSYLYGRGAIDDKGMLSTAVAALQQLALKRDQLDRDVIFMATAAEEGGPEVGIDEMVSTHFALIKDAEFALNEGGRVRVADGIQHAGKRYPTWNPVLFQPANGPLMLFYKVGPTPETWWGMVMTSTDDGRTWSEPRRLPEDILGPIKNKPVQLADGTLISPSSIEDPDRGWLVYIEISRDVGQTWELVGPLNTKEEFNAIQPSVLTYPDGRLQILSRSQEKVVTQNWSTDQGRTWSKMTSTGLNIPNSGSDAVTLADGRQLLVYNHKDGPESADVRNWGTRWPLNVATSTDGVTWKLVATLESEPNRHGYAYPAVIQTRDGLVHITYTLNRERIKHVIVDPNKL
jgi:predicted neuraminidase